VEFHAAWAKSVPCWPSPCALGLLKNNAPNANAQYDTGAATALLSVEATAHGSPSSDGWI